MIFKHMQRVLSLILVLVFLAGMAGCGTGAVQDSRNMGANASGLLNQKLQVHFIDVGQADAILIMGPDNQNIMIDAGNNGDSGLVVDYIRKQGVRGFKAVIGTHPHEDHIGGLDAVIKNFEVEQVFLPKVSNNTETFMDVLEAVKDKGIKISTARKGVRLELTDMDVEFLGPIGTDYKELNDYSAVVRIEFGDTSFLFEGDAEAVNEEEMLSSEAGELKADVIKIGHHGSSSSSTEAFIEKVKPEFAVISVGKNNDYKHPHKETMELLEKLGIPVYRTDESGTVIAESNGKSITFNCKPGSNSYGGSGTKVNGREKLYVDAAGKGMIKGNINSKGEKIYHMPGGAYYDSVEPEAWFKTEEEAKASGFRRAQR